MGRLDLNSGIPLYLQLKEIVQHEIEVGNLAPDSLAPSENTLVARYGVSRSTVRQAYQRLVDEGYLIQIRGKGTFVLPAPKRAALQDRGPKKSIAFLMRGAQGGVLPGLTQSIASAAFEAGYSTTICSAGISLEHALRHVDHSAAQGASGIIFRPLTTNPFDEVNYRICQQIKSHGLPFVFIDVPIPDVDVSCARSDNVQGGRLMGEYLREMGHREVVVVTHCENRTTADRIAGVTEPLGEVPKVIRYYHDIDGDLERKLIKHLRRNKPPSAVFALDDLRARKILEILSQQGIPVPDKVSVVGFDDLDFSELLSPPLTTIRQFLEEMGKAAVHLLLEVMRNPNQKKREILVPVQLVRRESVRNLKEHKPMGLSDSAGKEVRKRKAS